MINIFNKGERMKRYVCKRHFVLFCVSLCFAFSGFSQTTVLKRKASFNQNWKFYKGDASGASGTSFNDGSWATVNIPNSPTYDAANPTGEAGYYIGTCWYRKTFTVPANRPKSFYRV